ncbi:MULTISPECIES: alpha/beta hydrolase [Streptomyces]|jgi:predicted alpha/beta superfamily hydrolase|uniref:alpha/beta hydrolase n=1 Tax=Streptomyces TaxID=1883 RepID=UPI001908D26D|nr:MULTISPECIES: alpha/beta hydrolase-fold protein [unclassified Streptomyces]MCU4750333.1 alpha/beta hydrolase-fold protein [Streptomyces sp. G-5]QQN78202.1 alpha/beta hydrolase [Streptomyces sp. XC 2026]
MSEMWHGCLPDTEYLEITARSGHRYGVWVTTPPGYADSTDPLPLIYVLDGNWTVGLTAPLIVSQADPYLTIAPYIQVTIGYTGEEAAAWAQIRNRDLVPPGEPIGDDTLATLTAARESGTMTQEQIDAYLAELKEAHADVFLDFLTGELHPHLRSKLRVSDSGHGLFGYSYGGLFALYTWLRETGVFASVGAGSPGVASKDSQIFTLLDALPAPDGDAAAPRLHITLNEAEVLGGIPFYRGMARHVLTAVEQLHTRGRSEQVSHALLRETHVTGLQASFLSYLKTCHLR